MKSHNAEEVEKLLAELTDVKITCQICNKQVTPIFIDPPVPLSDWDKEHGNKRNHGWLCCGKAWFYANYGRENEFIGFDLNSEINK